MPPHSPTTVRGCGGVWGVEDVYTVTTYLPYLGKVGWAPLLNETPSKWQPTGADLRGLVISSPSGVT